MFSIFSEYFRISKEFLRSKIEFHCVFLSSDNYNHKLFHSSALGKTLWISFECFKAEPLLNSQWIENCVPTLNKKRWQHENMFMCTSLLLFASFPSLLVTSLLSFFWLWRKFIQQHICWWSYTHDDYIKEESISPFSINLHHLWNVFHLISFWRLHTWL